VQLATYLFSSVSVCRSPSHLDWWVGGWVLGDSWVDAWDCSPEDLLPTIWFVCFVACGLLTATRQQVMYRVAVGSMTEPSELGGAIHVAGGIIHCTVTRLHFSLTCP